MDRDQRRVRRLDVSVDLIFEMLVHPNRDAEQRITVEGVPEDAEVVGVAVNRLLRDTVSLLIWSASFEPLAPGCEPMGLYPKFTVEFLAPAEEATRAGR